VAAQVEAAGRGEEGLGPIGRRVPRNHERHLSLVHRPYDGLVRLVQELFAVLGVLGASGEEGLADGVEVYQHLREAVALH